MSAEQENGKQEEKLGIHDRTYHSSYKDNKSLENDEIIIEDNTIYEVDFECYSCLKKRKIKNK